MLSNWRKRTMMVVLLLIYVAAASADQQWKQIVLGPGSDPKWSPSGKRLAVWQADRVDIYDMDSLRIWKSVPAKRPWLYHWYSDDSLALSYKERTSDKEPWYTIGINGIMDLDGNYKEVIRDTVYSPRDYITAWQKIPEYGVGIFIVKDDHREKYLRLVEGQLSLGEPDTTKAANCNRKFLELRKKYDVWPSPNCEIAFAEKKPENRVAITDSIGNELQFIGEGASKIAPNRFQYRDFAGWSPTGGFFALIESVEDGHVIFSSNLVLWDLAEKRAIPLAETDGQVLLTVAWSDVRDEFAFSSPQLGGVILWRKGVAE